MQWRIFGGFGVACTSEGARFLYVLYKKIWLGGGGIMVSEFLAPDGTRYVMNLAWCGCTIFDHVLFLIKLYFQAYTLWVWLHFSHQIDYIRWCTPCGMGVASFHTNKLYLISWHEFDVGVAYFCSNGCTLWGTSCGMNLMWVWFVCIVVIILQARGRKVLYCVVACDAGMSADL